MLSSRNGAVKEIMLMSGCSVIHSPRLSPPLNTWKTPGGKIDMPSLLSLRTEYGVEGDGFMMNVFPVTSAGPTFPRLRSIG